MAGLPAQRDVFLAFVICGGLAGLAGFMYLVRFGNITVTAAQGLELQVVAAVVVGGVSILGGQGTMFGVLLGVMLIEVLQQSLLRWSGLSEFVKDAILGLLILIADHGRCGAARQAARGLGQHSPARQGRRTPGDGRRNRWGGLTRSAICAVGRRCCSSSCWWCWHTTSRRFPIT